MNSLFFCCTKNMFIFEAAINGLISVLFLLLYLPNTSSFFWLNKRLIQQYSNEYYYVRKNEEGKTKQKKNVITRSK